MTCRLSAAGVLTGTRHRTWLIAAAVAGGAAWLPHAAQASVVAYSDLAVNYAGAPSSLQTVGLAGGTAASTYTIDSITLKFYYPVATTVNQDVVVRFLQGVNETSASTNVAANATQIGAFFIVAPPEAANIVYTTTIGGTGTSSLGYVTSASNGVAPNVVSVSEDFYTDSTFTTYSTSIEGLLSASGPTVGTNVGYSHLDGNGYGVTPTGVFTSSDEYTASLDIAISATPAIPVPEPTSLGVGGTVAVGLLRRNRRRVRTA